MTLYHSFCEIDRDDYVIIPLQRMETNMKKIFYLLIILFMTFVMVGCQTNNQTDTTPPYFTGVIDREYTIGDALPDLLSGIKALDKHDGDITPSILVNDDEVNWTEEGYYQVFVTVTDQAGYETTASFTIRVIAPIIIDTTAPTITGTVNITYTIGQPLPDLLAGVVVQDDVEGDVSSRLTVNDEGVDYQTPGTYNIIYTVDDSKGNQATITIQITVLQDSNTNELTIYYINDTHGAIEKSYSQLGLSAMASVILDDKKNNPDQTLFIGGGDLLQGNILSNYYQGGSMMDILNRIQMDAFVIGNHEFDWGLDQVTRYRDPSYDGVHVDFPLLGANILRKDTMERPDFIDAYTVLQKGSFKVGIIGLIGYGLEDSIATSRISPYVFDNPVYWASYYTNYLRTEKDVDVIVVVIHDSSDAINQQLAGLTGNQKIDAIFNGHSHQRYTQIIQRNGVDVPVVQSRANGEFLGQVTLTLSTTGVVESFYATNLNLSSTSTSAFDRMAIDDRLYNEHVDIKAVVNEYRLVIEPLLNEVIIKSSSYYNTSTLTDYMATLIRLKVDADIGIHNYGGTRASLYENQDITVATLYQIFPFDNRIKYVYLTGSAIKDYANSSVAISYKSGLSLNALMDTTYYKVASNDYIFDKPEYPFIYGVDVVDTGILIRDVLEQVLRQQSVIYSSFSISHPITLAYPSSQILEYMKASRKERY